MRPVPWWHVLLVGLALYVAGIFVLAATHNIKLFPAVTIVGAFLVPVTYVVYIYQHRMLTTLAISTIAFCFFYGGMLGAYTAALVEPLLVHRHLTLAGAFRVGLIEEAAKIIGVFVIAYNRRHTSELNGLILGAAAGMGFAALESLGYAFSAFLQSHGDLSFTVVVTLIRAILAPFGHGTWTAILAAVLFRESSPGRFHLDMRVLTAYLAVAALHGLWDGLPGALSLVMASGYDVFIGELIVGTTSIVLLLRVWHQAKRRQITKVELDPTTEPDM